MSRNLFAYSLLALLLGVTPLAAQVESPLEVAPEAGIVVLINGQVLKGNVTRAGDFYFVTRPKVEIRLRAASVDFVCRTLEEAYDHKRESLREEKPELHLDLAEWCIRHGLLGPAAREISHVLEVEPTNPKLPLVERRLELARQGPPEPRAVSAGVNPGVSTYVPGVTNSDLDRLVRDLPEGSVETFTHTIQPLLLNRCTTAGCHGPRSDTGYSLLRLSTSKTPSRRLTQRNLHATLQQIDREAPEESPLLSYAIREHGQARAAPFGSRNSAQFQQLVNWVDQISNMHVADTWGDEEEDSVPGPLFQPGSPSEDDIRQAVESGAETLDQDPTDQEWEESAADADDDSDAPLDEDLVDEDSLDEPREANSDEPSDRERGTPKPRAPRRKRPSRSTSWQDLRTGAKPPRVRKGARYVPRDPFDAEVFNRLYER